VAVDLKTPLSLFLLLALLPALPAADLPAIRDRGRLRVLAILVNQQNDFISAQPGKGFDRELLEGFATLQRVNLEVVAQSSWDALVPALLAGKGDVIAGRFTATESRRKLIAFTHPQRRPDPEAPPCGDHSGGAPGGESRDRQGDKPGGGGSGRGDPPGNVDETIPTGTLPAALKLGRVTAVVLGLENAIDAQRQDPDLQLGLFLGPPRSLAYGLRKEDTELRQALSDYIDNLRRTPTWARLVVKYFGEAAPEVLRKARQE
jgi:ABC-type amino acid transport substrate-binding protein